MSETVFYTGKLFPVELSPGQSIDDAIGEILKKRDIKIDLDLEYYDSISEQLIDITDKEFEVIGDVLYRVEIESKGDDSGDIFRAQENSDGSVSFVLQYYNGGCGFGEALEEAIDNMEKNAFF